MSQPDLFHPAQQAIVGSSDWIELSVFGGIAATLCVIAVALIGLRMLAGRIEVARGMRTIVGVVVLLGAPALAASITSSRSQENVALPVVPEPADQVRDLPPASDDPYAGASLRRN